VARYKTTYNGMKLDANGNLVLEVDVVSVFGANNQPSTRPVK